MRAAYELGAELFDEHSHAFSRKDFTLPQLFACLVLREHQRKSYRGTEALLRDCSDLRDAAGDPTEAIEITVGPEMAFLAYRDPANPQNLDRRQWRDGQVFDAHPNPIDDRVDPDTEHTRAFAARSDSGPVIVVLSFFTIRSWPAM